MTLWYKQDSAKQLEILSQHLCVLQAFEEIVQKTRTLSENEKKEILIRSFVAFDVYNLQQFSPYITHIMPSEQDTYITDQRNIKHKLSSYNMADLVGSFNNLYSKVIPSAHVTHVKDFSGLHVVEVRSVQSLRGAANAPTGVGVSIEPFLAEALAATRMLLSLYTLLYTAKDPHLLNTRFSTPLKTSKGIIEGLTRTKVPYVSSIASFRKVHIEEPLVPKEFSSFIKFFVPKFTDKEICKVYSSYINCQDAEAISGTNPTKFIYDDATMEPKPVLKPKKYNSQVFDEVKFKEMYPDAQHIKWFE